MKKITTLLMLWLVTFSQAQLPVSQTAENKNVVLEEFTGIHCGYCPDGHKRAQQIYDAHPDDVVLINIHTGSYANPGAGEPDFRTSFGTALANQSGLTGYPSGTVNRHIFSGSHTAMGRGSWSGAADQILNQSSYVNVALEATVDTQTREMTVNVEIYYTADSPQSYNYLNVALLQNNVEGPQAGSSLNPDQVLPNGNYNHMHMLRHLLTGQWGEEITTTTQGTLVQKQYTYTLPADINGVPLNLGDLEIAAFVAESHQEIISGSLGTVSYTNLAYTTNAALTDLSVNDNICNPADLKPKLTIYNNGSNPITEMTITYNVNGGADETYNWTGNLGSLSNTTIDLPDFNFAVNANNTLNVTLTSINGNTTDDNVPDNTTSASFNETPYEGQGASYIVTVVQDQYGTETTWVILNENGDVITYGGPYNNLSGAGTTTHHHNVLLDSDGCYTFVILDSYGDGINGGYGNGSYKMEQADGTLVFQGDGTFTSEERTYFRVTDSAVIDQVFSDKIVVYPNPSKGLFTLNNVQDAAIQIYNMQGIKVFEKNNLDSHTQINISQLADGIYLAKFIKDNKIGIKKIIINK